MLRSAQTERPPASSRATRSPSSRATMTMGSLSISPAPVKNVVLARGHERDCLRLTFHREVDDRRSFRVLGEEIVPSFENGGVHQKYLAGDVTGLLEICRGAIPDVDDGDVLHRRERGSPGHRHCVNMECGEY